MAKITQGRVFALEARGEVLCLSFTSDNRFLLSSHKGGLIVIWNIVDNELYKELQMIDHSDTLWHCFTPDNQFMISVTRGRK
jgi:WD40 repeat protein